MRTWSRNRVEAAFGSNALACSVAVRRYVCEKKNPPVRSTRERRRFSRRSSAFAPAAARRGGRARRGRCVEETQTRRGRVRWRRRRTRVSADGAQGHALLREDEVVSRDEADGTEEGDAASDLSRAAGGGVSVGYCGDDARALALVVLRAVLRHDQTSASGGLLVRNLEDAPRATCRPTRRRRSAIARWRTRGGARR